MLGVYLHEREVRVRDDLPIPDPPPGEARVRVLRAGICNTDLELIRGYYPFSGVLGHEFVGQVETGPDELVGRRVVGEINAVCGRCSACGAGRPTHCQRRTVLGIVGRDGAFAEYLTLPVANLHLVPDSVPTDHATFTEPLAAALRIRQQVALDGSERVLVVGDGKLGQLIARTLVTTGCDLRVHGRHVRKLELLTRRGIRVSREEDPEEGSFDAVVECTGDAQGFALARRCVRPLGTLVLKSTYAGELTLDASAVVVDEVTLVGSRCGPFAPALDRLAERAVGVESLVDARYPLDRAEEALEHAGRPGVLKVLLDMEGSHDTMPRPSRDGGSPETGA